MPGLARPCAAAGSTECTGALAKDGRAGDMGRHGISFAGFSGKGGIKAAYWIRSSATSLSMRRRSSQMGSSSDGVLM
jgi:hypothetical protein